MTWQSLKQFWRCHCSHCVKVKQKRWLDITSEIVIGQGGEKKKEECSAKKVRNESEENLETIDKIRNLETRCANIKQNRN